MRWALVTLAVLVAGCGSTTASSPAAPDKSPAAAAAPAKSPVKAGPQVLIALDGSGTKSTQKFTAAGDWDLHYTYDCAPFGQACNFIVTIKNGDGSYNLENQGISQTGLKGEDTQHYHKGGTYFLEVTSEGTWHLDVKG